MNNNEIKRIVGYLFTESSVDDLKRHGFNFVEEPSKTDDGSKIFLVPLDCELQFCFQVIVDEEKYRHLHQIEHFFPYQQSENSNVLALAQTNTVISVEGLITKENCHELAWKQYFEIRKPGSLWAIHLRCNDMNVFREVASPDKFGSLNGKLAALIHLGPSCFDLIVTEAE